MDPYLEDPALWPSVHANLIVGLQDALLPLVEPRYYVAVDVRVYVVGPDELSLIGVPDDAVLAFRAEPEVGGRRLAGNGTAVPQDGEPSARPRSVGGEAPGAQTGSLVLTVELPKRVPVQERYLEVRDGKTHEVVTVFEVLSPTNKRGTGRREYEEKRLGVASSLTNLVEIDLLRAGVPLPVWHVELRGLRDYRVLISRGHDHHRATLHAVSVRESLPPIAVPLQPADPEPQLDLQAVVQTAYDRGRFGRRIDYRRDPVPPLASDDARWADALLRAAGLRA